MGEQNERRVQQVGQAIESVLAYATSYEEGGAYQAGKDFLCDMMHWCDDHGENFEEMVEAARLLYEGEVEDDE